MKFRNVIIFIVILSMLFLHSSFVCPQATVQINSQSTETNEESKSEINTYTISGVDASNYCGYTKPNNGSWDGDDDICQKNYFASYYFKNLKNGYFGNNTHGSCGYVAAAMMLSYYDTYLNDNIIDEKYDKEGTLPFDFDLSYSHESPGIEKEPTTATTSTGVNKDLEDFTAEEYWNYIEANWQNNFQLYLIKIAEEQYNMYHDRVITLTENGITWNTDPEFPCASAMLHMKSVIEYYLCNEIGYGEDKVTLEYENMDVRNFAISKIKQGQPVMLFLGSTSGCHFVVAYDLDDKGTEDTADDDIYAHYGWGDDDTHININTDTYPWLISAMAINFTNSVNHLHSNNYIGAHNKEYCSCFYSDHPAHECSRYYKEYNDTYHTYACDCNLSEEILFEHELVYTNLTSDTHDIYCSGCDYYVSNESHNYQYVFIDGELHELVCGDCGYKTLLLHNFVCEGVKNSLHYEKCTDCGYIANRMSDYQCTSLNSTQHEKECNDCGYSETKSHTVTKASLDDTYHQSYCSDCGHIILTEAHTFIYTAHPGRRHSKTCSCGYSTTEACVGRASIGGTSYCVKCGQEMTFIFNPMSVDEEEYLPNTEEDEENQNQ